MKTPQMRLLEQERGTRLEDLIRDGIEAGRTWDEIAYDLGVTRLTLRDWTRRMGGRVEMRRTVRFDTGEPVGPFQQP